jgi:hypothetical protein
VAAAVDSAALPGCGAVFWQLFSWRGFLQDIPLNLPVPRTMDVSTDE